MNRILSPFVVCLILGISPQMNWAEEPALPELKPLERFVGSWKTTVEGADLSGEAKTRWILGGRFVQQKYSLSNGSEGMILRGYDSKSKKYIVHTFDSKGNTLKQEGTWDKATDTLTVEGETRGAAVVTKAHFPDENTEEWTISLQNKDGKVIQTIKGKNIRPNR